MPIKKVLLVCLATLMLASVAQAFPTTFFTITEARLYQLGEYDYRVHLKVDWGGDIVPAEDVVQDLEPYAYLSDFHPAMYGLVFTGAEGVTNMFAPGTIDPHVHYDEWTGETSFWGPGRLPRLGYEFWFDFRGDYGWESVTLDYAAYMYWGAAATYKTGENIAMGLGEMPVHKGALTVTTDGLYVVPEPASVLLFGLGFLMIGATSRKRPRQ